MVMKQRHCLLRHLLLLSRIILSKQNLGQWYVVYLSQVPNFINLLVVNIQIMPYALQYVQIWLTVHRMPKGFFMQAFLIR